MDMVDQYKLIKEMREYATLEKVPIMFDDGIDYLTTFILKNQIENILEIGTAIGYSAIMMCLVSPNVKVTSIERDEKRYLEAIKNVKKFQLEERITLIYNDASEVKLQEEYDMIVIDAAKAQNKSFFLQFERNLKRSGYIVTDNMNFHGLVFKDERDIQSRNVKGLVRKIKDYKNFLIENLEYETIFLEVGDGLAISRKK